MPNPIPGTVGNDYLEGTFDDDVFSANSGDDYLVGSYGFDTLNGGAGTDVADYSNLGATVTLGAYGVVTKSAAFGTDILQSIEAVVGSTLAGDTIDLSGALSSGSTTVTGSNVSLLAGSLTVSGLSGSSSVTLMSMTVKAFENVVGTIYNDVITGDGAANNLNGNSGDDFLDGDSGNDLLLGGSGNDGMVGGSGIDTLIGGAGQDKMTGGTGNDLFRWSLTSESPFGTPDYITDFVSGDKLDFKLIDAKASTPAFNDPFTWIGLIPASGFTAEGQLGYKYISGNTHILGNTSGSTSGSTPELEVVLIGTIPITATAIIL